MTTPTDTALLDSDTSVETHASRSVRRVVVWPIVLLLAGLASVFVIAPFVTDPSMTAGTREHLSDQQSAVTAMAGAAAGLSVATDLIPNVDGLPNQLADLSGWFIVIIAAIILQKVLIAVVGYVSFTWILPASCALGIAYTFTRREVLRSLAIKLAIFATVLFLATPTSIAVSNLATDTFNSSQATVARADAIQDAADEAAAKEAAAAAERADAQAAASDDQQTGILGMLDDARDAAGRALGAAGDAVSGALDSVSDAKEEAVAWMDSAIQQIALWIITTCVVPLLTIALFAWVIKILFGFEIPTTRAARAIVRHTSHGTRSVGRRARAARTGTDAGAH